MMLMPILRIHVPVLVGKFALRLSSRLYDEQPLNLFRPSKSNLIHLTNMKTIASLAVVLLIASEILSIAAPLPPGYRRPVVHGRAVVGPRVVSPAVRGALRVGPRRVVVAPGLARRPVVRARVLAPRVVVAPRRPLPIVPVVRVYHPDRNVVVVESEKGESQELPYVAVPLLFAKGTAEFADAASYQAVAEMAAVISDIVKESPDAAFDIEGHTCTDGSEEANLDLSARRAKRVHEELTARHGISQEILSASGYGEGYAAHPNGAEAEKQLDRRVLLVRTR